MARATAAEIDQARALFEAGDSLGKIAKAAGRNRSTITRWAQRHHWARPDGFADALDATSLAVAHKRRTLHWLDIRLDEANAAADLVTAAREQYAGVLKAGDHKNARLAVLTWAITVDKAKELAQSITADEANTDPNRSDPAQIERAIRGIVDALTPAGEQE